MLRVAILLLLLSSPGAAQAQELFAVQGTKYLVSTTRVPPEGLACTKLLDDEVSAMLADMARISDPIERRTLQEIVTGLMFGNFGLRTNAEFTREMEISTALHKRAVDRVAADKQGSLKGKDQILGDQALLRFRATQMEFLKCMKQRNLVR